MVRKERLELSRVTPQEPKSSASTNSATFAKVAHYSGKQGELNRKSLIFQTLASELLNGHQYMAGADRGSPGHATERTIVVQVDVYLDIPLLLMPNPGCTQNSV